MASQNLKEIREIHFERLDICKTYDLEIDDGIYLPLNVHIKDLVQPLINVEHIEEEPIVLDEENNIKVSNVSHNNFKRIREQIQSYKSIRSYFKFIDTNIKLFENGQKSFMEYYDIDDLEELFERIDDNGFSKLIAICDRLIKKIIEEFYTELIDVFYNGEKEPNFQRTKEENDPMLSQLMNYSAKPKGYLLAQIGVEFPANVFFKENIGKSISEWSWREVEFQIQYIGAKNNLDNMMEKYKTYSMEKAEKDNKQKGR